MSLRRNWAFIHISRQKTKIGTAPSTNIVQLAEPVIVPRQYCGDLLTQLAADPCVWEGQSSDRRIFGVNENKHATILPAKPVCFFFQRASFMSLGVFLANHIDLSKSLDTSCLPAYISWPELIQWIYLGRQFNLQVSFSLIFPLRTCHREPHNVCFQEQVVIFDPSVSSYWLINLVFWSFIMSFVYDSLSDIKISHAVLVTELLNSNLNVFHTFGTFGFVGFGTQLSVACFMWLGVLHREIQVCWVAQRLAHADTVKAVHTHHEKARKWARYWSKAILCWASIRSEVNMHSMDLN